MLPNEKFYLGLITEFIDSIYLEPQMLDEYSKGYLEALADLKYAASLGKEALHSHLIIWTSFVSLNDNDDGYVAACSDVLKEISKMNESERWSFD